MAGSPPLARAVKDVLLALVLLPMLAGVLQDLLRQVWIGGHRPDGALVLAVLLLAPPALRWAWRAHLRRRWRRRCLAALRQAFLDHGDKLALNHARLVHADDYGLEDTGRWFAHLDRFVVKLVLPRLRPREQAYFARHCHGYALAVLDEAARRRKSRSLGAPKPARGFSGADFEQHCMDELRRQHWRTRPTAASGDQGADIIAEHQGRAVVFQCKYHSAPVGNKAVQEVAAARHYYRAQAACVVSNQGYTRSARALAATSDVFLIHHSELPGFRRMAFAG